MVSKSNFLEYQQNSFIENNREEASLFQWIFSKGTNYTCYVEYINSLSEEDIINYKVDRIRNIIYTIHKPLLYTFFYWIFLLFILYKFNFKKPVMKIILANLILNSIGDILEKLGFLIPRYYQNTYVEDSHGNVSIDCKYFIPFSEIHPLRWILTRQLNKVFWIAAEIVVDWYPLYCTRVVAKNKKSLMLVYITCIMFNLSKILMISYNFTMNPADLYNTDGVFNTSRVEQFEFYSWIFKLIVMYSSVIYDCAVISVLKKSLYIFKNQEYDFWKKFKSLSEYRIIISSTINAIGLPIVSISIIVKYFYYIKYHYKNINSPLDELRILIVNIPYYMIFFDQILLLYSNKIKNNQETSLTNSCYDTISYHKNDINIKGLNLKLQTSQSSAAQSLLDYTLRSDNNLCHPPIYYNSSSTTTTTTSNTTTNSINRTINNNAPLINTRMINNINNTSPLINTRMINNSSPLLNTLSPLSSHNNTPISLGRRHSECSTYYDTLRSNVSNKSRTLANYDEFDGNKNEWIILK